MAEPSEAAECRDLAKRYLEHALNLQSRIDQSVDIGSGVPTITRQRDERDTLLAVAQVYATLSVGAA